MVNSLQGLRVIGMLFIFLSHCGILIGTKYEDIFYDFFYEGYCVVTFFFILSGFVSYKSLSKKEINTSITYSIKYTIDRIKRFYLLHFIIFIFMLLIKINKGHKFKILISSILNLLLIQSFVPIKSIYFGFNAVTWYLSSLVICYLLTNLFAYSIHKIKNKNLLYYIILIWIIQFSIVYLGRNIENIHYIFYINPLWRSIDFFIGMILGKILLDNKNIKIFKNIKYSYIEISVTFIFLIMYFMSKYIPDAFKYGVYYTPIFICIITIFYYQKGILSKIIGCSYMVSLANISFEFYMIHQIILSIVNLYLGSKPILLIVVAFLISIILSKLINIILNRFYTYKKHKLVEFNKNTINI